MYGEYGVKTGFRWCILRGLWWVDVIDHIGRIWCNKYTGVGAGEVESYTLYEVDLSIYLLCIHLSSAVISIGSNHCTEYSRSGLGLYVYEVDRQVRGPGRPCFDEMRSISELSIGRKKVPIRPCWCYCFCFLAWLLYMSVYVCTPVCI